MNCECCLCVQPVTYNHLKFNIYNLIGFFPHNSYFIFPEQPGCLAPFAGECWCWDGASISQDSEKKLRESKKKKEATLLDLRNYLFIRQCALLFQLDRVQDVLQRMLEFMHNVVHELEILKVRA